MQCHLSPCFGMEFKQNFIIFEIFGSFNLEAVQARSNTYSSIHRPCIVLTHSTSGYFSKTRATTQLAIRRKLHQIRRDCHYYTLENYNNFIKFIIFVAGSLTFPHSGLSSGVFILRILWAEVVADCRRANQSAVRPVGFYPSTSRQLWMCKS